MRVVLIVPVIIEVPCIELTFLFLLQVGIKYLSLSMLVVVVMVVVMMASGWWEVGSGKLEERRVARKRIPYILHGYM